MQRSEWLCLAAVLVGGCSAIVNPNTNLFDPENRADTAFGFDAGRGAADGGGSQTVDTGVGAQVDANRPDAAVAMCVGGCDDGVDCTEDMCTSGSCSHILRQSNCGTGERCTLTGCVSDHCTTNSDCDDNDACNGMERCDLEAAGSGCVAGRALDCTDEFDCTVDGCNAAAGCVHSGNDGACDDGVDCTLDSCNTQTGCAHRADDSLCSAMCMVGASCDAEMGCVGGAVRVCPPDADPCTQEGCAPTNGECFTVPVDADGDGFPAASVNFVRCQGTDCDDSNPAVRPGVPEACNGTDDNCNGMVDEGCPVPDRCDTALRLTLTGEGRRQEATFIGSFAAVRDDLQTDCASMMGSGGRDAFFTIDLPGGVLGNRYDVMAETITNAEHPSDTVIAAGLDCGDLRTQCNDDRDSRSSADPDRFSSRIWLHNVSAPTLTTQRVLIMVDGFNGSASGTYELHVVVTPAVDDSCGSQIDITGGGTLVGRISGLTGNIRSSCAGNLTPDAFYQFTSPDDSVFFEVSGNSIVSAFRTSCGGGDEVSCEGPSNTPTNGTLSLPAGHYLGVIDNGRAGQWYRVRYDP